ncbi:Lsr2 family protein [uncultured Serinicoccus sp.]|uniref:histone-like nucleoid-structuring protein Lsr2 n=1 Tax=uncultured Serinicoccus sp. TaxID=735514 RepID=UPI00262B1E9E|nr:Lsr2 family protein [uncultured Serinicoccus sp.]
MVQSVRLMLIDDVDGTEADQTVSFALDGVSYTIDLHDRHATQLRGDLSTWIKYARRTGGRRQTHPRYGSPSAARGHLRQVRRWAHDHGYQVNDRGRVAQDLLDAYDAAHTS